MVAELLNCQESQVAGHAIFRHEMPQKLLQLYPLVKAMIKVSPGSVEGDTTLLLDGDGGSGDGAGPVQGGHMG